MTSKYHVKFTSGRNKTKRGSFLELSFHIEQCQTGLTETYFKKTAEARYLQLVHYNR